MSEEPEVPLNDEELEQFRKENEERLKKHREKRDGK